MKTMHRLVVMLTMVAMILVSVTVFAATLDDRIVSAAKQSYTFKTYLKQDDIKIESRNGAVTLTGIVAASSHKVLAQETVSGLPGVTSVDNRLELKGAAPTANSDAWIREKVKFTLLVHPRVSTATTEVDVANGVVTLRGTATSQAQKDLTTEYAKDVAGVKAVKNTLTVVQVPKKTRTVSEKIDDASITAQAKMTLLYHRSTSALATKVATKNGVVTVSGKAGSAAEIDLVTKIVKDVNGVQGVKNRMTIE